MIRRKEEDKPFKIGKYTAEQLIQIATQEEARKAAEAEAVRLAEVEKQKVKKRGKIIKTLLAVTNPILIVPASIFTVGVLIKGFGAALARFVESVKTSFATVWDKFTTED